MSQTDETRDEPGSSPLQSSSHANASALLQTLFGRVVARATDYSTIELEDGELICASTTELSEFGLARLGTLIAIRRETLTSGQQTLTFEPANDIESPDEDAADGLLAPPTRRSASELSRRYAARVPSSTDRT